MGQQGQCPMCGAMFMFPMIGGQPGAPMQGMPAGQMPSGPYGQQGGFPGQPMPGQFPGGGQFPGQGGFGGGGFPGQSFPGQGGQGQFPGQQFPGQNFGQGFPDPNQGFGGGGGPQFAPPEPEKPPEPRIFRILCPKGHELQTPEDMLGTQALCPYCNTQMELRYEDSVEYKKQKELEQRIQDEKTGRFWMTVSIWGAVIVGLLFVGLVVLMFVM